MIEANYLRRSELLRLGFTESLIGKLFPKPDMSKPVKRGRLFLAQYFYLRSRVDTAMQTPEFLATQARRQIRAEAPARRRVEFTQRYQNWRGALPDACCYLHSLNRFTKHRACSFEQRAEIYALKNRLVELLYSTGYCTACWIHAQLLPAKSCRACDGTGYDGECDRCDGTGVYLPAKTVHFYVFKFAIGRGYTWHQPDNLVKFSVETTREPEQWGGVEREKAIALPQSKFAAAKDLLRWVLDQAANVPDPPAPPEREWPKMVPVGGCLQEALF